MAKVHSNFRLSEATISQIDDLGKATGRSRASVIEFAVEAYWRSYNWAGADLGEWSRVSEAHKFEAHKDVPGKPAAGQPVVKKTVSIPMSEKGGDRRKRHKR